EYMFTNEFGCTASVFGEIVVNPLPEVLCPDDFAVCIDEEPFMLSGATPEGGIYSGPGILDNQFRPAYAGLGDHIILYTYFDLNGCSNSCEFVLTVHPLPGFVYPQDIEVCENDDVIEFNPQPDEQYIYDGNVITSFDPAFYGPGDYLITYIVTNEFGCSNGADFTITVYPAPVAVCVNREICENGDVIEFNPTAYEEYDLDGQVIDSFDPAVYGHGLYEIIYTIFNDYGCWDQCSFTIEVFPIPVIVDQPEDVSLLWGSTAEFTVVAEFADAFLWYGPSNTEIKENTSSTLVISDVTLDDEGLYYCDVINECAIVATISVQLDVLPWEQIIELNGKLSGVSTYLELDGCDVATITEPLGSDILYLEFVDKVYIPGGQSFCWEEDQGGKLALLNNIWPTDISVFGYPTIGMQVDLNAGWNIMPVWSQSVVSCEDIFDPLGDAFVVALSVDFTGAYWKEVGINTLEFLVPGSAYLVKLTEPATVNFDVAGLDRVVPFVPMPIYNTIWNKVEITGKLHSVAIDKVALSDLKIGDIIGAFNQFGKIAGMVEVDNTDQNLLLRVYADDYSTKETDGFYNGDVLHFMVYRPETNEEFEITPKFDLNLPNTDIFEEMGLSRITELKASPVSVIETAKVSGMKVYPNPATDVLNIVYSRPIKHIQISNLVGQMILQSENSEPAIQLDVSGLETGLYILKIETVDGFIITREIVVK
nr:T9SS type A sorting domain-containing protein [Bacteroidota bacterium]